MSRYDAVVAAGMARLDEQVPGWEWRISLANLNVGSCSNCVVGQLSADYAAGLESLGVNTFVEAVSLGFALPPGDAHIVTYAGLTRAWKYAISDRLAAVASSAPQAERRGMGE